MTLENTYSNTLNDVSNTWGGYTHVQVFSSSLIGQAVQFRLTLQAPVGNNNVINQMFIGARQGSVSFFGTPIQVMFNGQPNVTIPAGQTIQSDLITLDYDASRDLIVATSFSSAVQSLRINKTTASNTGFYFKNALNDAGTLEKSGYSASSNNPNMLGLTASIDVERPEAQPPAPPIEYAPFTIVRDDTIIAPWPIELVSEVKPVLNYTSYIDRAHMWRRFAHVFVPDVQAGDVLTTLLSLQGTNPQSMPLEFVVGLVLTPSASGTAGCEDMPSVSASYQPTNGIMMSRMGGRNLTGHSHSHHGELFRHTHFIVPEGLTGGDYYVAAIGYAGGSSLTNSNTRLVIDPYCSDMSVNIKRKELVI